MKKIEFGFANENELLPEAAIGHKQECIRGFLLGFLLMMALDVALG